MSDGFGQVHPNRDDCAGHADGLSRAADRLYRRIWGVLRRQPARHAVRRERGLRSGDQSGLLHVHRVGVADAAPRNEREAQKSKTQKLSGIDAHLFFPDADERNCLYRLFVPHWRRTERCDDPARPALRGIQRGDDPSVLIDNGQSDEHTSV